MRILRTSIAVLAMAAGLAAVTASSSAFAQAAPTAWASGLSGALASQGSATAIAPVNRVLGSGIKAYSHGATVPLYSESIAIVVGGKLVGSMTVVASGIVTHVASTGTSGGTTQVQSSTSIASLQITMSLTPPAGSTAPPAPLLSLTATNIASQVTDSATAPLVPQQAGTASFGSLTLGGSLVSGQPLTFEGAAPANTVLYSDANMTVTLNQQELSGVIACTPICQFVPQKMIAAALQVEMFHKVVLGKSTVTGNFQIAQNEASVP